MNTLILQVSCHQNQIWKTHAHYKVQLPPQDAALIPSEPQILCAEPKEIFPGNFSSVISVSYSSQLNSQLYLTSIDCISKARFLFSGADLLLITAEYSALADQKPEIRSSKHHANSLIESLLHSKTPQAGLNFLPFSQYSHLQSFHRIPRKL